MKFVVNVGMADDSDTKRAVRTALRSLEAMASQPPSEESCQLMAAAVQQLAFAIEKLIAKVEELERRNMTRRF